MNAVNVIFGVEVVCRRCVSSVIPQKPNTNTTSRLLLDLCLDSSVWVLFVGLKTRIHFSTGLFVLQHHNAEGYTSSIYIYMTTEVFSRLGFLQTMPQWFIVYLICKALITNTK